MLGELRASEPIAEAAAVSTCNRSELYLRRLRPGRGRERGARRRSPREAGIRPTELVESLYSHRGSEAARHLFEVAAGLDSMILGEAEIQGQVKRAYELALVEGATGPILNRLFRGALATGKRVRTETRIGEGGISVPSAAVELAQRSLGGDLRLPPRAADRRRRDRRADREGAGRQGASRPSSSPTATTTGRSASPSRFGGEAVRFDELPAQLARGRHRRLLDQLPAPHRRARGARADDGRARGPAAAVHRPRRAPRHRAGLHRGRGRQHPRRRRRAVGRRSQLLRPRGRGASGPSASSPPRPSASSAGSTRSRCCRRSPRCAGGPTRSSPGCWPRTRTAGRTSGPRTGRRIEAMARAIASRILHEPTLRLKRSADDERRLPADRDGPRAVRPRREHRARGRGGRGDADPARGPRGSGD